MKIVFDHQIFSSQTYGGISRYFVRLAEELVVRNVDLKVISPLFKCRYLSEIPPNYLIGRHIPVSLPKSNRLIREFNNYFGRRYAAAYDPDIVHETYFNSFKPLVHNSKTIITVYDMIHELFADRMSKRDRTSARKRLALARADHIIAISNNTKLDLMRIFEIPEDKISVVHLGYEAFAGGVGEGVENIIGVPYILYVGSRGNYKNFTSLLRAYVESTTIRDDFKLVTFGDKSFIRKEHAFMADLGLGRDEVTHITGSDEVLGALYHHASAFVYPSLYEGFGLPPLEAMAHHCPVVSSNTSSMPEVIGNAAEYFDPESVPELVDAIESVVYSPERSAELRKLGEERLKLFSWSRCADETLAVYKQVLV